MLPFSARSDRSLHVGETGALFLALSVILTGFGILMIYSASSIVALTSQDYGFNPAYFAIRQAAYAIAGAILAAVAWYFDYHAWSEKLLPLIWGLIVLMLGAVLLTSAGADAYGATRWLSIGSVHLQPSEFAKPVMLLCAARIFQMYYEEGGLSFNELGLASFVVFGLPLFLVIRQPDKGSVLIMVVTIAVMLFLAGFPLKYTLGILAAVCGGIWALANFDSYSRARIEMMNNPWVDPYHAGYQLIQGYYAFGSGGLLGVGLGMSRQKYSYLPMAYNDFILAVTGEELGFVGLVVLLMAFLCLAWLGLKIAREAPDMAGRLIAAGAVTMMFAQLMVNACGVVGLIPLSGKPVPFMSYGGSSIVSTLILVGLVLSVARASQEGSASRARDFSVLEGSTGASGRGFRVISGGRSQRTPEGIRQSHDLADRLGGRVSYNANGTRRVDLGRSPTDRLRGR